MVLNRPWAARTAGEALEEVEAEGDGAGLGDKAGGVAGKEAAQPGVISVITQ
jgi:hypothetical protein